MHLMKIQKLSQMQSKYKSFINVNSKNYFEIEKCINLVIESYKSKNRNNIFLYKKW